MLHALQKDADLMTNAGIPSLIAGPHYLQKATSD
jgi:hypothetical protein